MAESHYLEPPVVKEIDFQEMARQNRYPEVLVPNQFTSRQPWQPDSHNPLPATIPIYRLSHITHLHEKLSIFKSKRKFIFNSNPKLGKVHVLGSCERAGVTYKHEGDDTYKKISSSDQVFPGYLSWWGIDVRDWYEDGCELLDTIITKKKEGRYAPGYLAHPTESPYGDQAFSTSLSHILQAYSKVRRGCRPCLKVGGTLHYRLEICYVVIVCTHEDKLGMPSITTGSPQFVSNGLVDKKGRVVDYQKIPEYNATSIIRSKIVGTDSANNLEYSWEQLVFAFYFPKQQRLECTDVTMSVVSHKGSCQQCRPLWRARH